MPLAFNFRLAEDSMLILAPESSALPVAFSFNCPWAERLTSVVSMVILPLVPFKTMVILSPALMVIFSAASG